MTHKELRGLFQALSKVLGNPKRRSRAQQRALVAALVIAAPRRHTAEIRRLTGASCWLIRQVRAEMGAPAARGGRRPRPTHPRQQLLPMIERWPHANGDAR